MRLENDDVFNTLYRDEFSKIPAMFRFSRKRIMIVFPIWIFFIVAMCITTSIFYETKQEIVLPATAAGYEPVRVATYNYGILTVAIVFAVIVVLLSIWMVLSKIYEKRAFAKATDLSARLNEYEIQRKREIFQDWKLHKRDD